MRVLVLDDKKIRHDAFDRIFSEDEVTHVFTFSDAKKWLKNTLPFDLVSLDHDLEDPDNGERHDTWVDVWGKLRAFTGAHVAVFIAFELAEELRPKRVSIHSVNPEGAQTMKRTLEHARIPVTLEPFAEVAE